MTNEENTKNDMPCREMVMTNEEAINYLRTCFAPTCNICPIGCKEADLAKEARQMAIMALLRECTDNE